MGAILSAYAPTFPFQGDDFDVRNSQSAAALRVCRLCNKLTCLLQDAASYTTSQSRWDSDSGCMDCCQGPDKQENRFFLEEFANFWLEQTYIGSGSQECDRCPETVLHDSATSLCPPPGADRLSNTIEFLRRMDTANVNETDSQLSTDCGQAQEHAGRAVAALPPLEARKTFLLGPACPPCCPRRTQTAEGINALHHIKDVDIGDKPVYASYPILHRLFPCNMLHVACNCMPLS